MEKYRIRYRKVDTGYDLLEEAVIVSADGTYACTVERCIEEGSRRFRQRARKILAVLNRSREPLQVTA